MHYEPILLIPSYRSGRETPWAGDTLHRRYEKYTLGSQIGESYDFCTVPPNENCSASGKKLTSLLSRLSIPCHALPYQIKWIDAREALSLHVHTKDVYLFVVHMLSDACLITAHIDAADSSLFTASLIYVQENKYIRKTAVSTNNFIHIPAGTPYSIAGATCYQLFRPDDQVYRLYDWKRTNARGQARTLQPEKALSILSGKSPDISSPSSPLLLDEKDFSFTVLKDQHNAPLHFDGRFAVLSCLGNSLLRLTSGKCMYLAPGQTALIPQSDIAFLTAQQALLSVFKV